MAVIIKPPTETFVLESGEYAMNSTTGEYRVGDGTRTYENLIYPDWNDILATRFVDDFLRAFILQSFDRGGLALAKISNTIIDYGMGADDGSLFVTASSVDIEITLPDPTEMLYTFNGETYSKIIQITKKDSTLYKVKLLPFASEKIIGEDYQYLESQYDNLTLISDGTNYFER